MTRRDLSTFGAGLVALLVVGYLAGLLVTRVFDALFVEALDRPALEWLAEQRSSGWNSFMRGATTLGSGVAITVLTVVTATAAFLSTRDRRWPGFLLLCGLGGTTFDKILKPLVGRPRPQLEPLVEIGGNSFPSGHATGVTALWLAIALFVHLRWRSGGRWVWPLASAVIGLVLLSRPYLGVHYPSDVVAGALLSAGWVVLCLRVTGLRRPPPEE